MDSEQLIADFDLSPHPEGGFYRETFRSAKMVSGPGGATRAACTQILYLLPSGVFSAWHRVSSDEIWHHHQGGPLQLHLLDATGHHRLILGRATDGHRPHAIVPAGVWQAARPHGPIGVLCGCTVAPGFEFADFEMARPTRLLKDFPKQARIVAELCR